MKRLLTVILISALLLVPYAAVMETVGEQAEADRKHDELTVGNTMPLSGMFFTNMWGNGTSDNDVRDLLHGYNLVEWNAEEGRYALSGSVVSGSTVTENRSGDHTYSLFLYTDLTWSDGSPVTAWDYAFSLLLRMDPKIRELGGAPLKAEYLLGYQDYIEGRKPYLAGVQVLGDYQLKIILSHAYLPFFFETALLDCCPYPMSVIAPGSRIADDGKGVYFREPLDTEELKKTILDPESGYMSHPSVVSGPYLLSSFDGEQAVFERNPYYKGEAGGRKPSIQRIVYRTASPDTMIRELAEGGYGLLNKAANAQTIREGLEAVQKDSTLAAVDYLRTGLTFISFNTEKKAVSGAAVRRAIAMCLDKDGLAADYVGEYGRRVDGYYGLGQWMVRLLSGETEYPSQAGADADAKARKKAENDLRTLEELRQKFTDLPVLRQDLEGAKALLDADGWTLNRAGNAYTEGTDDVRCREMDGELIPLELTLKVSRGNAAGEYLKERLAKPLREVGIQLTIEESDNLLSEYYDHEGRTADMEYLAENFDVIFDPSAAFEAGGALNHTQIEDARLYELALAMRRTEPGDLLGYCRKWLAFQERFMELEPVIPVYSNVYYDFYTKALHGYDIRTTSTWSRAVASCYMSDIEDALLSSQD